MMDKREFSVMADEELIALAKQVEKEREHRRQARLSQYRCELEQMWGTIVAKVKELDKMDISVSIGVEKEGGDLYFSLTDLLKEEGFMVTCHTTAVYKSKY